MSNIKITDLNAAGSLAATDVVPVVDVSADETKKITATNLFRTLPDGTAAAPALAFSSDQANGVYLAGTDTVGISTGGTQRVTVDGSGNVTISGDLTVSGATTTVESTTVTIDDKNIELGSVATPTDTTADGGGITLKGATDKTLKWINSTDSWTFNQSLHVNYASNDPAVLTIENNEGSFNLKANAGIALYESSEHRFTNAAGTEVGAKIIQDGAVELYHNNIKKLETKSDGIDVVGEVQCDFLDVDGGVDIDGGQLFYDATNNLLRWADNAKATFGASNDLQIYHDATDSYVDNTQGDLYLRTSGSGDDIVIRAADDVIVQSQASEAAVICRGDGQVELYHDATKKLETKSDGIDVTGEVQCDSLDVDGAVDITGNVDILTTEIDAFRVGRTGVGYGANIERSGLVQLGTNLTTGSESVNIELNPSGSATFSGNVGIGTSSPNYLLTALAGSGSQNIFQAGQTGVSNGYTISSNGSALTHQWYTSGGESARIDTSGRLLIGTTSARANFLNGSVTATHQVEGSGTGTQRANLSVINNSSSDIPGGLFLGRSKGTSVGSNTLTTDDDWVGRLSFLGNDGAEFVEAARIAAFVDGTSGSNDMPGRLVFSTTADGASSPTERLRISSSGELISVRGSFLRDVNTGELVLAGGNVTNAGANIKLFGGAHASTPDILVFRRGSSESMRIDSSGRLLLGTTTEGNALADNLTIADSGNCGLTLRSGTSDLGSIYFSDGTSGASEYRGQLEYNHSTDALSIYTAGSSAMRIDSSGRVGIGTSSPGHLLTLKGTQAFEATNSTNNWLAYAYTDNTFRLNYNGAGADEVVINSSGNVGISTTSPAGKLSVGPDQDIVFGNQASSGTSGTGRLVATGGAVYLQAGLAATSGSDAPLIITGYGGVGERLRIDSSGRLMLGTTTEGDGGADNLTIAGSGACGITIRSGTASSGNIYFSDATSGTGEYDGYIQYQQSNRALRFATAATERLRITSTGAWAIEGASNYGTSGQVLTSNGNDSPTWQAQATAGGANAISMNDSVKINLGAGSDLQIYHNGTNSLIDNTTGALAIRNLTDDQDINLQTDDGSGGVTTYVRCDGSDGMVRLYHYGTQKFQTESGGIDVTGTVKCDSLDVDGGADITGNVQLHANLYFPDADKAVFGNGDDLQIYHDGNHSQILDSGTGNLQLLTSAFKALSPDGSETYISAVSDGAVELYYNNSKKLETTSDGVVIGDGISSGDSSTLRITGGTNGASYLEMGDADDTDVGQIAYYQSSNAMGFRVNASERMRINSDGGIVGFGNQSTFNLTGTGFAFSGSGTSFNGLSLVKNASNWGTALYVSRDNAVGDGTLIEFAQGGATEGSISVSGSTVSYNGGHLSRWSQTLTTDEHVGLLKGTVMTNLDEMCEWAYEAQEEVLYTDDDVLPEGVSVGDVKTPARAAGFEDNEQLNKMAVSSVEGDPNVAGVMVNIDDDGDLNVAMTGDMIIRIAQGTTVARGDLLMSAGDGTAKPQDDDIVRSKTIAKVTSTTVSTTYADGSYCVPCVLMAC